jgi:Spy/CpxP family protein refolding chaperone
MKKLQYALLMLALLAPAAVVAQEGPGGEAMGGPRFMPSVEDQLDELTAQLKLTSVQKPRVKFVLHEQREQMKNLMLDSSGSREDNMSKMREIRQSSNAQLRALLTDEQKIKFDKMQEDRRKRMEARRRGGDEGMPPPPPPDEQ